MKHAIGWFELPSEDFDRAVKFYGDVLGTPLQTMDFNGTPNGIFPYDQQADGVGGAVIFDPKVKPSADSVTIYLETGDTDALDAAVGRVTAAGGKVVMPRTDIGDPGFIAFIMDTEGNRVGLHAPRS